MDFNRISILGVGLLGGSIGLAIKAISTSCKISGYGHRSESVRRAQNSGAIDVGFDNSGDCVQDAELVVICTPVNAFATVFREIAGSLAPGSIVTDVGSTKRSIVGLARHLLPAHAKFIGSHPMAGSERRGVESACADLFKGAVCVTTQPRKPIRPRSSPSSSFGLILE